MDKTDEYYIADAVQNFGNQMVAVGTNRKDRQFAREESQRAYDRSLETWNMTNAYNTPKEQMKRFSDAGLNKNLVYGNMANTPATNSVQYQPAKGSYAVPTSKIDNARYASIDQTMQIQSRMLEQTIRMNDQLLQNMEIKNQNMQADTENKQEDHRLKQLKYIADSLGIEYDYGYNAQGQPIIVGGSPGQKQVGMKDFDFVFKARSNDLLEKRIKAEIQGLNLNERKIWWAETKQHYMEQYGTNIDKDPSVERRITMVFDELRQYLGF